MLTPLRVLQAGLVYIGAFLLLAWLGLPAEPPAARLAASALAAVLPALAAVWGTSRAGKQARGAERVFWTLLAGAAAAQLVSSLGFALQMLLAPSTAPLRTAGHLAYYTYVVLVLVALLARPDRPRAAGSERAATVEWLMAVGALYFLLFYFLLVPTRDRAFPWLVLFTLQAGIPAAWSLVLAVRAGAGPFRPVYTLLGVGFTAGALAGVGAGLLTVKNAPWDIAAQTAMWLFPMVGFAAASVCARGPAWVRAAVPERRSDRGRARLAVAAVALPPLVDLTMRLVGASPELAEARSEIALIATPLLAVLAALRLRLVASPTPPAFAMDSPEVRAALGVPSECLQFASGVAHELNNPLMAVVGWAELALRREGPMPAVRELMDAAHRAAEVVQRLQKVAQAGENVTPPRGVAR
jgi:signal transduction histidine kinase